MVPISLLEVIRDLLCDIEMLDALGHIIISKDYKLRELLDGMFLAADLPTDEMDQVRRDLDCLNEERQFLIALARLMDDLICSK